MLIFCGHYPKQDRNDVENNYPDHMELGDCWLSQTYFISKYIIVKNVL